MTPRERLAAAFRCEQPDRIPLQVRGVDPVGDALLKRHESFRPLVEAVARRGDLTQSWGASCSFLTRWFDSANTASRVEKRNEDFNVHHHVIRTPKGDLACSTNVSTKGHPPMRETFYIKSLADVEKFLSIPYVPHQPDVSPFFKMVEALGERGIVLASPGMDAISFVHELLGSELLAIWSLEERETIHRLLRVFTDRQRDLVKYLVSKKVGPFFATAGHEYVTPPLHPPKDFYEFVVKYDKEVYAIIRDAGGFVHVHCHGPIRDLMDGFLEMDINCLHPIEGPPMGNVPLAEAKAHMGKKICLEGNIQIGDIYSCTPQEVERLTIEAIRAAGPGGGFILCPTASPYTPTLPDNVLQNYLAFIRTADAYGAYPLRV